MDSNRLDTESIDENTNSNEFKDCEEFEHKVIEDKQLIQSMARLDIDGNSIGSQGSQSVECGHKLDAFGDFYYKTSVFDTHLNDCFETQSIRSNDSTNKQMIRLNALKFKENRLLEKWGESVGIYDTNGLPKRLVNINELNNYFELKLSSINNNNYLLFCSLINCRYPRFYTSTVNYYQRWRMRYNMFVSSEQLVADTTDAKAIDGTIVHIGEIHLYFDIVPKYCQPVYVNSSFYPNKSPINVSNVVFDQNIINKMTKIVNSIRYSKDIFQFKFPVNADLFHRKNDLFDKFMERQIEFIEESIKVFRKNEQKKRKFQNWSQREFHSRERHQPIDFDDNDCKHNHQKYVCKQFNTNKGFGKMKFQSITQNEKIEDKNGLRMEWNESIGSQSH